MDPRLGLGIWAASGPPPSEFHVLFVLIVAMRSRLSALCCIARNHHGEESVPVKRKKQKISEKKNEIEILRKVVRDLLGRKLVK